MAASKIVPLSALLCVVLLHGTSTDVLVQSMALPIKESAEFTRENPGYPISYSTEFVKDNSRAIVQGTAEYTETTREVLSSGELVLEHKGAYVAQFNVTWKERSYDEEGNEQSEEHAWPDNGKDLTSYWSTTIQLPGNAYDINVFIRGCTGLAWDWWRTTFSKQSMPLVPRRKISIYGSTLNQLYELSE